MTYSTGGLIQASDFNGFAGGTAANVSGQINSVWSTGQGNAGYGQTSVSNVSVGGTVAATDWASLINKLNSARTHQSGSGSGVSAPTAGSTVTFLSTLSTALTSAYTNRLSYASSGTVITGSNDTWNPTANATSALSAWRDCNVTFANADACRYFFNAGGTITMVYSAVDNAGTTRSTSLRDAINAAGGLRTFGGYTNNGRSGTGGTILANVTSYGYWNNTLSSPALIVASQDTNALYSTYFANIQAFTESSVTTNGANGLSFVIRLLVTAAADDAFGGNINLTITSRCDITPPETTNLTNTWGTPTIAYDSV